MENVFKQSKRKYFDHTFKITVSKCINNQDNKVLLFFGRFSTSIFKCFSRDPIFKMAPASSNLIRESLVNIGSGKSLQKKL